MTTNSLGHVVDDYRARHGRFKDIDVEKDDMISELIEQLEKSRLECRQKALDLESERAERRRHQGRVEELETVTRSQNGRAFVLVLIDADANDYIFREKFLSKNEGGGKNAADELHARTKDYLRGLNVDATNTEVIVKAYADFKGLQTACLRNGKMKNGASLGLFAHGFNQRQGLFDFVDVGAGKEGVDNKVRECLSFFVGNWQCKHIVLGACHDSGYASFLGKFAADVSTRDRITLLYNNAIHPRIAALGFQKTVRLDTVFAPRLLVELPISTAGFTGNGFTNPFTLSERLGPVLRDTEGKRIDKKLKVDVRSSYLNVLRGYKLCYSYYLRGRCQGCDMNHVLPPFKAREYDCLWYVAREGMCRKIEKGEDCDDPKCFYRHEIGCQKGSGTV